MTTEPSFVDFRNEKLILGARIEDLVKPFLEKYRISRSDIEIHASHAGCLVQVKV